MTNPGASDYRRSSDLLWRKPKFGLPLSSSGVFKEFGMRQQKKNLRKLESQAGKVCVQNQKLA